MLRRALTAKECTLMRLQHAFQHLAALRGLGISHPDARDFKALLRVPCGVLFVDSQRRLRDESQPAPLKIRTQLEDFGSGPRRGAVALPGDAPLALIFTL